MNTTKRIFALGFFDGVHLGHQALLAECVRLAETLGVQSAAITFDHHPQAYYRDTPPALISTETDRRMLLARYGIEYVHTLPVTQEIMSTSWRDFLDNLLALGAVGFVCGDDFRFGFHGEGSSSLLMQYCRERELPCVIVPEQTVDGIRVSSTYIRQQIESGDMATAVKFLGHPYYLTGSVIHGQQLGRKLGIPTANLHLPEGLTVPKFGVYACLCPIDGISYPAVTNIGTRPTVNGQDITVEAWILDYTGDLYGRQITLEFQYFLRPEKKFDSLEALQAEIRRNAEKAREYVQGQSSQPE